MADLAPWRIMVATVGKGRGMDGFYRGIEVSLLGFSLLLGLGAILLPALPGGLPGDARMAVTLPMIAVTADP